MKKRVVVIGGGTGQATLLRGLKLLDHLQLTTIVTVADDGGSTGRLREQFDIPAMGDIRNVLVALAESETLLSRLMNYRFQNNGNSEISGHNLGNLIITALTESNGNFMEAISSISKVLNVKGDIVPSSLEVITLFAEMVDGSIIKGETNIPKSPLRIRRVFYQTDVKASLQAVNAIQNADVIVYGVGSLYTSICPNLIIKDIQKALQTCKAKKIYICNAMSQPGETDNFTLEDHVEAIMDHSGTPIDLVIKASDVIPQFVLDIYKRIKSHPIVCRDSHHDYQIVHHEVLDFSFDLVRHDPVKIALVIDRCIKDLE